MQNDLKTRQLVNILLGYVVRAVRYDKDSDEDTMTMFKEYNDCTNILYAILIHTHTNKHAYIYMPAHAHTHTQTRIYAYSLYMRLQCVPLWRQFQHLFQFRPQTVAVHPYISSANTERKKTSMRYTLYRVLT